MVAYSFKQQFVAPILSGAKRQTIRADRKRHAREGETLQLYTGLRTRSCCAIGTAICLSLTSISINLPHYIVIIGDETFAQDWKRFNALAKDDGFSDWQTMWDFWWAIHPKQPFSGVLIRWTDFKARAP